jgi:flagellar protein FliO/FliZ
MDYDIVFRFLIALVFVLGLIGLLAWVARRFGLAGRVAARPGRRRRTMVVEAIAVDAKRRLVLVRRDDVEHLILLGPTNDLLVEQGIAVPAEHVADGTGTPGAGQNGGKPRDFGSELKARLGFAGAAETSAPTSASASPAASTLPASKRRSGAPESAPALRDAQEGGRRAGRLAKNKLAQLKPERFRLGKQPETKR